MAEANDTEVTLSFCDDVQASHSAILFTEVYTFAVLVSFVALSVGLDSLRTTPNRTIRYLLAATLGLNVIFTVLQLSSYIYPFNCQWETYRTLTYFGAPLSMLQGYLLPVLSMYRALAVFAKDERPYIIGICVVALANPIMDVIYTVNYWSQIHDDASAWTAVPDEGLLMFRFVFAFVVETGAMCAVVGRVLVSSYSQDVQVRSPMSGLWMTASVLIRLGCVIAAYTLASLARNLFEVSGWRCEGRLTIAGSICVTPARTASSCSWSASMKCVSRCSLPPKSSPPSSPLENSEAQPPRRPPTSALGRAVASEEVLDGCRYTIRNPYVLFPIPRTQTLFCLEEEPL